MSQHNAQKSLCILGATGSIGQSTLDVVKRHPHQFSIIALTAHSSYPQLLKDAKAFNAQVAVLTDSRVAQPAREYAREIGYQGELRFGTHAACDVASLSEVDCVMAAIVGGAGLPPTFAAVTAGKIVLLANKEALVMSGDLFIAQANAHNATILPIDSEHNAIFQCLPHDFKYGDLASSGISKILLTGSGGPFIHRELNTFSDIDVSQACAHPNWSMGQKISVDSATMMNKGLEYIEAKRLFGLNNNDIEIVLHPQSTIHSMVQYVDGSVIAQMGQSDMRTPIAHALAYPQRISSGVAPLDFAQLRDFSFTTPCSERYPNLFLALEAAQAGQSACTVLNAANEIAVEAFLHNRIRFTDIYRLNAQMMDAHCATMQLSSIEDVLALDETSRQQATVIVSQLS